MKLDGLDMGSFGWIWAWRWKEEEEKMSSSGSCCEGDEMRAGVRVYKVMGGEMTSLPFFKMKWEKSDNLRGFGVSDRDESKERIDKHGKIFPMCPNLVETEFFRKIPKFSLITTYPLLCSNELGIARNFANTFLMTIKTCSSTKRTK